MGIGDWNDNSIEIAIEKYIEMHNKTKKFSTQYSSNEIRDISDVNLINKIQSNIIKKTKVHNIEEGELIDYGEKILLWDNIKFNKGKFVKASKEKAPFLYPDIFSRYLNNNIIEIIPSVNFNDHIKKETAVKVDYITCVIIPEFCYDYYLKKYNDNNFGKFADIVNKLDCDNDSIDYMVYNNIVDEKLNLNDSLTNKINDNENIDSLDSGLDNLTGSHIEKISYPKKIRR